MVLTLSDSSLAISETVFPEAIIHMTLYSRSDRLSWGSCSAFSCTTEANLSAREELTYFPPVDTFRMAATNSSGALSFVKYPEAPSF